MKRGTRARRARHGKAARGGEIAGGENRALDALRTSALALFGLSGVAHAESPTERVTADYNYAIYAEDELDASKGLPGAENSRYEVEMHQVLARLPITGRIDLGVELVHETMSGASPWYTLPDAAGTPIQVMSGATIEDTRQDVMLQANYHYDDARLGFGSGYSSEKDYSSLNFSLDGERHYNAKNTTFSTGMGVSFDTIEPTDAELFITRPSSEDKQSYSFNLGLSQVLGRRSLAQTSLTYKYSTGFLSDPYKQVFVVGGTFLPDVRPGSRHQLAWLTRYRRHVEELDGTLHANYQFYLDDWDVHSHTVELAWHQSLSDALRLIPSVRYYTQSEADFFVPYLTALPAQSAFSSDYRLSSYGALRLGVAAEYGFRLPFTGDTDWKATVSWERYRSSPDLSFYDVPAAAPGLVSYHLLSVGLRVKY
jgi:hypothetical protein